MRRISRRACAGIVPALLGPTLLAPTLLGGRRAHAAATTLRVPLLLRTLVAPLDGGAPEPVVTSTWIDEQLEAARALFTPHVVGLVESAPRAAVSAKRAEMEDKRDRDDLVAHIVPSVVNVFFVRSLRDVDDPSRMRMGVTWRCLRDLEKKYVIVAAYAPPQVLAHELGHFLGLSHSSVKNNLMSYDREPGKPVFLDAGQGAVMRDTAMKLIIEKKLVPPYVKT